MKKGMNKSGQFQMSFSMMFSIFLIVVFIVVAIFAIAIFLGEKEDVSLGIFLNDLEGEVKRVWMSSGGESSTFIKSVEADFDYVCFYNSELPEVGIYDDFVDNFKIITEDVGDRNFYFYPSEEVGIPSRLVEHINMEFVDENPYCIAKSGGKVKIQLDKNSGDALVRVSRTNE